MPTVFLTLGNLQLLSETVHYDKSSYQSLIVKHHEFFRNQLEHIQPV
jgi:hypothetical protein